MSENPTRPTIDNSFVLNQSINSSIDPTLTEILRRPPIGISNSMSPVKAILPTSQKVFKNSSSGQNDTSIMSMMIQQNQAMQRQSPYLAINNNLSNNNQGNSRFNNPINQTKIYCMFFY